MARQKLSSQALADQVAVDTQTAIDAAAFAKKQAQRAHELVPKPDPREDVNYRRLTASPEESWLARLSPRRNRWPHVRAFDERVAQLDQRQEVLRQAVIETRQRREGSESRHAEALARWHTGGKKGERPSSDAGELDERIADLDAEQAALDRMREHVLAEKGAYVERHRRGLVRDAEKATQEALERVVGLVDELERARQEVIDLRQTAIWAALFPSAKLQTVVPHTELAPSKRIRERVVPRTSGDLLASNIFQLLREDARYFATASTLEQAADMQGVSEGALRGKEAMWAGSDEDVAFQQREKKRLMEEHARIWGSPPAEFG